VSVTFVYSHSAPKKPMPRFLFSEISFAEYVSSKQARYSSGINRLTKTCFEDKQGFSVLGAT